MRAHELWNPGRLSPQTSWRENRIKIYLRTSKNLFFFHSLESLYEITFWKVSHFITFSVFVCVRGCTCTSLFYPSLSRLLSFSLTIFFFFPRIQSSFFKTMLSIFSSYFKISISTAKLPLGTRSVMSMQTFFMIKKMVSRFHCNNSNNNNIFLYA